MRIELPVDQQDAPLVHIGSNYAREIVSAGIEFSKAGYQHSKLSLKEFEGARARTAEINGCRVCIDWRSGRDLPGYFSAFGGDFARSVAARGPAPDNGFYAAVSEWRTSPLFSERERLAIAYAEGLGLDPHGIAANEEFWQRAKAAFTDQEIVDLSFCIAAWMGLGRITHALGMDGVCSFRTAAAAA